MTIDNWISLGSLFMSIFALLHSFYNNIQNRKLRKEVQERDNRLQANSMYEKVRNKREIFEDKLSDLVTLDDNLLITEKQRIFHKTYNKYVSLYNEIEDFCTKIYDGVIKSEQYLKETVLPSLNELAELQVEFFKALSDYSEKNNLKPIKKPDYKAFDKYDKFLIQYNGGETSYFWKKVKNLRRESGFE